MPEEIIVFPPSPIPREFNLSYHDFRERYARHSLPVVMTGAIGDWPLLQAGRVRERLKDLCGTRQLFEDGCGGKLQKGNVKVSWIHRRLKTHPYTLFCVAAALMCNAVPVFVVQMQGRHRQRLGRFGARAAWPRKFADVQ